MRYVNKICIPFAVIITLLLMGCVDVFNPSIENDGEGALTISVSGGLGNRTLFPSDNFTKYKLTFDGPGVFTHDPVELLPGQPYTKITGLPEGLWTIKAEGIVTIVTINGTEEYTAAEGSQTIDITAGVNQNINITISASQGGDDGFFTFNVTYPDGMNLTSAVLELTPLFYSYDSYNYDLLLEKTGQIELLPGFYLMSIRLTNDYMTAGRTEVVHIYTNMETEAFFEFTADDFTELITLSGRADITIDGCGLSHASVRVSYGGIWHWYESTIYNGDWQIKIPAFDESTLVNFSVYGNDLDGAPFGFDNIVTRWIHNNENVDDIVLILNLITISGNLSVTIDGELLKGQWVWLYLYREVDDYRLTIRDFYLDGDGNVTFKLFQEASSSPMSVYFRVAGDFNGNWFDRRTDVSTTVGSSSINNIDIHANFTRITLSGDVNITINGNIPQSGNITVFRWTNYGGSSIGQGSFDFGNSTWQANIDPFYEETEIFLSIHVYDGNRGFHIDITTFVHDESRDDIHINGTFSYITLGGTANITINGNPPQYGYIDILVDDTTIRNEWFYTDKFPWQVIIDDPLPTNVSFNIHAYYDGRWFTRNNVETRPVHSVDILDIDFIIDFSAIILSGNANITINGNPPQARSISVYPLGDNMNQLGYTENIDENGYWQLALDPFDTQTHVLFSVGVYNGVNWLYKDIDEHIFVYTDNISGIDFNIDFSAITISGTADIDINVHGYPPLYLWGQMYVAEDNRVLESVYIGEFGKWIGNWNITIPAFDKPTNVSFRMTGTDHNYNYFQLETGVNLVLHDKDESGIHIKLNDSMFVLGENYGWNDPTGLEQEWSRWTGDYLQPVFNGERLLNGEFYLLHYSFSSDVDMSELSFVVSDRNQSWGWNPISNWTNIARNIEAGKTYSGSVVISIIEDSSSSESRANLINFQVCRQTLTQPTLTFDYLYAEPFQAQPSVETWIVETGQVLNIVDPGFLTIAQILPSFNDRNDVLHISPSVGSYGDFVIEYDLSEYEGQTINIAITTDVWVKEDTLIAWQINSSVLGWPVICGGVEDPDHPDYGSALTAGQWHTLTGDEDIPIPKTEGRDGKILYLSGMQIDNAEAYFANFRLTITVVP